MDKIIYTLTDEAPLLATYSLLPVVESFAQAAGVELETRDISLSARILSAFPEYLTTEQQMPDALAELGELSTSPEANIIKLPNISASLPQLKAAIQELQSQGYPVPDYPESPANEGEANIRARYDKVKGSAVNPVLRQGNSDRRAPESVKNYARNHPHSMGEWNPNSRTRVATMSSGDFRSNEQSTTIGVADTLTIQLRTESGIKVLKTVPVEPGDILDGTLLQARALDAFLAEQVSRARDEDLLFSVHLKATMMKVSDPVIFGHVVKAFFKPVFDRYGDDLTAAGLLADDGLGAILAGLEKLPDGPKIRAAFDQVLAEGPKLSMVDSARGVTNLHVPSDVIIDASMPAMIRNSGQLWGPDGKPHDTLAVIPDSSYAGVYQAIIDDCRSNGAFDPTTMGTVANVGLMAGQAEEYGSHDKTFLISEVGILEVVNSFDRVLIEHEVGPGDIWRACLTRGEAVRDWVKLAVTRARITGWPAIFWLDPERAHDNNLVGAVIECLGDHDTQGLEISIQAPHHAAQSCASRARKGENTISVTGNVLRDYLTDLFPILEVGTSAKMLSIVPLMGGGGMFETGAGGSAPRHVQQFLAEGYLRWDSLGEFLALWASFDHIANRESHSAARVLAQALDRATETFLNENRSPGRALGTIDNRGSHFYLALYWARELATQTDDPLLASRFAPVAEELAVGEKTIVEELLAAQAHPVDIGGYYHPDPERVIAAMRPSATFNKVIDQLR